MIGFRTLTNTKYRPETPSYPLLGQLPGPNVIDRFKTLTTHITDDIKLEENSK